MKQILTSPSFPFSASREGHLSEALPRSQRGRGVWVGVVFCILLILFLTACGGGIDAPKNLPAGYTIQKGDRVGLALPSDWTSIPVSPEDFQAAADKIRNNNPALASRMDEMADEIRDDTLRFWANHHSEPVTVNIAAEKVTLFEKLDSHARANREGLEEAGFKIVETGETELNGKKAAYTEAVMRVNLSDTESINWMLIQYTLIDDGTAYSISAGMPEYLQGEYAPIFETIANTFHTVD